MLCMFHILQPKGICSKKYKYTYASTYTRLLGRFALIFYFNFKHFLFVYIVKQKQKKLADFIKNFVDFENLLEIEFWLKQIFETLIIHEPSLGSCRIGSAVLTFIGHQRTDRHPNRQTPKQTSKIYI